MSSFEFTNNSRQSTNNGLSNFFELGKTDHDYIKIKHEPTETFELEDILSQQKDDRILSTATAREAIMKLESELKYLCSLKVSDNSHFSGYTNLEPSIELPIDDTLFLESLLNERQTSLNTNDDDWLTDFPVDSFDQLLTKDSEMTFKELTDMNTEHSSEFCEDIAMNIDLTSTTHDETTNSSTVSSADENERNDVNRRGLKKSGGPVRKLARFGNKQVIKYSDEYHDRRIKNNEAVKKSRLKAKHKQKETESKMLKLATENRTLNDRVDLLMKELQVLKSLYRELNQDLPSTSVKALERVNIH